MKNVDDDENPIHHKQYADVNDAVSSSVSRYQKLSTR